VTKTNNETGSILDPVQHLKCSRPVARANNYRYRLSLSGVAFLETIASKSGTSYFLVASKLSFLWPAIELNVGRCFPLLLPTGETINYINIPGPSQFASKDEYLRGDIKD
jgi:hypothetical protein